MIKNITLADIISGVQDGTFTERDVFRNSEGFEAVLLGGVLKWMAGDKRYISEAVKVSPEAYNSEWSLVTGENVITLGQAVDLIADRKPVAINTGDETYKLDSLSSLDKLICNEIDVTDLALSVIRPEAEAEVEVDKLVDTPKPVVSSIENLSQAIGNAFRNVAKSGTEQNKEEKDESEIMSERDRYSKKLTASDAWDIHHMNRISSASAQTIAGIYNVSDRMIYYVLDGTHWDNVKKHFDNYLKFRGTR